MAGDRRNIQDGTIITGLNHQRGTDSGQFERGSNIKVERRLELLCRGLSHRLGREPAGIVNHDIDTTELRHGHVGQALQLVKLQYVRDLNHRAPPAGLNICRHLLQISFGARSQYNVGSGLGERTGNASTYPLAGACNHGHLPIQSKLIQYCHCCLQ
jgi:hypothetical protein